MSGGREPIENLAEALWSRYPELEAVRAAATEPVFVVGGAIRDLLLGRVRTDLDLVVEGDAAALADRLGGGEHVAHERFATAKVTVDGHELDIASARSETYPAPGSLPLVEAAGGIEDDLARRDFSVNAMAVPLSGGTRLIDPFDGRTDLERRLLRVLHPGSFADDPTRAIRAARYAGRFDFDLEPETERLMRTTDLNTVSGDRREAELTRLAAEPTAPRGFELLGEWGLVEPRVDGVALARRVDELLDEPDWGALAPRERALLAAALGPVGREERLAEAVVSRPSEGVEMARGADPVELILARALGAAWLDAYVSSWRKVTLEIDGGDLLAAGVTQGPALGRGLEAALRAKLDGEVEGREAELAVALAAAHGA